MLPTILLTVAFFGLAVAAMAIGVTVAGKRLSGSCGGLGGSACTCDPEKQAKCKSKNAALRAEYGIEDEDEDEGQFELDPLARPGEERLIQLRPER